MSFVCSAASVGAAPVLDGYRSDPKWYLVPPTWLHGDAHAARVMVWANLLGRWLKADGVVVDLEVVRWSALLHDVRRVNDGRDPAHGERAAAWILAGGVPVLHNLGPERVDAIAACCRWHVPPDSAAPSMTPELACLKDADALDRVRLGLAHVGPLRLPGARLLLPQAVDLLAISNRPDALTGAWSAVRVAAQRLGVWSPDYDLVPTRLTPRHACTCC